MTDQDKMELVSAAIDGELDVDEHAELESLLDSSEEARELKAELEQLDSMLKGIPALDPPESLPARIMAEAGSQSTESKPPALDWLRQLVPGAGIRYAIAASAGALVAAVILDGQTPLSVSPDSSDLVGTMAPDSASAGSRIVDSIAISDGRHTSRLELRVSDGKLFLNINADSGAPIDIAIDLGGSGLWPDAMAQIEGRPQSIGFAGQSVTLRSLGQQRTTILLRGIDDAAPAGEASIKLEISSQGRLLGHGTLDVTW